MRNPVRMLTLLILTLLAALAARMARRTLRRGTGDYAAIMAALWELAGLILMAAGTAKSRATEARLNALVPRLPVPQFQPGTTAGGVGPMGSVDIGYDPQNSANEGGSNSVTSGQIGGASAHYHSMTHMHSSSSGLQSVVSGLAADHNALIADHNALKAAVTAAGILH